MEYECNDYPEFSSVFSYVVCFSTILTMLYYFLVSPVLSPFCIKSYRSWPSGIQRDFDTRFVSTLHAVSGTTLTFWVIVFEQDGRVENQIVLRSVVGQTAMQISLGFFIGDLLVMLSNSYLRKDSMMLFHHVTGIISTLLGLVYGGAYVLLVLMRLFSELSTPFVNMRWVFETLKVPKTSLEYKIVGILMTLTFFFSRILPIPLLWYYLYQFMWYEHVANGITISPVVKLSTVLASCVLDSFNVYWSYKIGKGFVKYVLGYGKKAKN